jgi:hypothetical protein
MAGAIRPKGQLTLAGDDVSCDRTRTRLRGRLERAREKLAAPTASVGFLGKSCRRDGDVPRGMGMSCGEEQL